MTTKLELLTREYFKEVMGDSIVYYNHRPDWLKNEKTGKNFELDIFYPYRFVAIEVNGIFHKLDKIAKRDSFKRRECRKKGIKYFYVRNIPDLSLVNRKFFNNVPISVELHKKLNEYEPSKCFNKKFRWLKRNESADKGYDVGQEEIRRNLTSRLARGIITKDYYDKKMSEL
jgi:hypothetical protein